jgi:hydroxymethylbilane synthase
VRERLAAAGSPVRLEMIHTSGDRLAARSLADIGGKGVFVKEIEQALLDRRVDLAVHSLKDLPTEQPDGLTISCVPPREDPRDVLVPRGGGGLAGLRHGAAVGTGSPRRACQIRALRADLEIRDLRGNVDTRIEKLRRGDYDAIVLALAGLRRLGLAVDGTVLDLDQMLPAVGQGAMAVEIRSADQELAAILAPLHDDATARAVRAERALLRGLGGGCQAPIAAVGTLRGDRLELRAMVGDPQGRLLLRDRLEGPAADPEAAGERLARALLDRGAADLVRRSAAAPPEGP